MDTKTTKGLLKRDVICLTLALIVLMATISVMVQAINSSEQAQGISLSLRGASPPSDEPLFLIESTPNARYLRGAMGIEYDGSNWHLQRIPIETQTVSQSPDSPKKLPFDYTEVSQHHRDFDENALKQASVINDSKCLQLPDGIPYRVMELSQHLTEGISTPFEKARAIETFLKSGYRYNLDYIPAPSDQEANDWFLFEVEEGICGNFNSAFVILARAAGIPARLAAGYYVRPGEGEQTVYANQAHAWAEVGFEELGWVAFEAVP